MKKLILLGMFVLSCGFTSQSFASKSPDMPPCHFTGEVKEVSTRREPGRGISEGETFVYIDIKIAPTAAALSKIESTPEGCPALDNGQVTVQITPSMMSQHSIRLPQKGHCIKGFSRFSADGNFMSGDWLTIEETLPAEGCQ